MSEGVEGTETTEPAGRGRPRPSTTIERDEKVLTYLKGAWESKSRKQIVEALALPGNEVYLSLYRLSRGGLIKRDGGSWSVVTTEAPPAE